MIQPDVLRRVCAPWLIEQLSVPTVPIVIAALSLIMPHFGQFSARV